MSVFNSFGLAYGRIGPGICIGGDYDDSEPPCLAGPIPEQEKICGKCTIRFYSRFCELLDQDSNNSQICSIARGSSFTTDCSGATKATINMLDDRYLEREVRDLVDIHLDNSEAPCWKGYIVKKPTKCDTSDCIRLELAGLSAQLKWGCVNEQFQGIPVHQAVNLIVSRYVVEATDISYEPLLVSQCATYPVSDMSFEATTIDQALSQLADLAGGYEYGVDSRGRFYFSKPGTGGAFDTSSKDQMIGGVRPENVFHLCKNVDDIKATTDTSRLCNQIFVKYSSDNDNGVLPVPLNDGASQDEYGVRCCTVSAPSSLDPVDAYRYGAAQLQNLGKPIERATIGGIVYEGSKPRLGELVRVFGKDGCVLELPAKELTMSFQGGFLDMRLQLGEIEHDLAQVLLDINTSIARDRIEERTSS